MDRWVDLAMVAHELGGALAPTRNAVQLLRAGNGLEPEQERLLTIAGRGLERAERVLQNLSSIAWLEESALQMQTADLGDTLRRLVDDQRAEAQARGIRLHVEVESGITAIPLAAFAFEQVMVNLLSNALKFTPADGQVRITAAPARGAVLPGRMLLLAGGFGCRAAFVKIRVDDTGIGIRDETRRRLFQPFCRGSEAAGVPGMGLGLAVAQRLARRMGGDLRAETPPQGAAFVLTLPADAGTRVLVERVDALVEALSPALMATACSVAVLRHDLGRLCAAPALEDALRRRLADPRCGAVRLSETTLVVWSASPVRGFTAALATLLRQLLPASGAAALRLAVRRVPQGTAADPMLLQAAVRCRVGLEALGHGREVLHGQDSRR